ncbi:MAG: aryl-sulfate sulfotransferase, partial [Myxococcota bacterium]
CGGEVRVIDRVDEAPHERESDRRVTVTFDAAAPAALVCRARDDGADRVLLESPAATTHGFEVMGLRPNATYDCAVGPTCPLGPSDRFTLPIGPPDGFDPQVTATSDGPPPPGWLLMGVETEGCIGPGALAIFDPAGRLRWHYPLPYTGMDYEILDLGGRQLVYGGHTEGPGPVALDLWDGVLWAADLPGDAFFHHDVTFAPDGRLATLEERTVTVDGDSWTGFAVRAFDPDTFEVSWEYDSQRAADEGALPPGSGDAWHANWIRWIDHGAGEKLYVSLCAIQQVMRIDVATGATDWVFGAGRDFTLVDPGGAPLPDGRYTQCQHGLDVSDDGTSVLAYDNGRQRGESRVVEYGIDGLVATERWAWTDGWYESLLGDADWLPDGSVLVTQAHSECYGESDRSEIVRIDPTTGAETWRMAFEDEQMAIYRSEWIDGCRWFGNVGQCPALEPRWAELAAALLDR